MDIIAEGAEKIRLTGVVLESGECARCGRELGKVFQCSDGSTYGRRCVVKVTGWKYSEVEAQAKRAARQAEVRRRSLAVAEEMPGLRAAPGAHPAQAEEVLLNVVTLDCWWGGRGWSQYRSWREYVEFHGRRGIVTWDGR
jgi:hypothetical protein